LKKTTTSAANETMKETKSTLPRKEWITLEIVELIGERRKYKNLNTVEHQRTYWNLRNLIVRKSKEAKGKYLEKKCEEIDILMRTGKREAACKMVKMFFGVRIPKWGELENNEREIIKNKNRLQIDGRNT